MSFICHMMKCVRFSRKIKNNKRRQQLLQIEVEGKGGYIFRSASEKGEIEEIQAEMQRLQPVI